CRFFTNPAKFLMTRRLGLWIDDGANILEEREAFQFKGLEKYQMEQDLLGKRLGGRDLRKMWPVIHASGQLPPGVYGNVLYEDISGEIEQFVNRTSVFIGDRSETPLDLNISLAGFRITGVIADVYQDRLVKYRYARIRPRDRLIAWIHHLALSRMGGAVSRKDSLLIGLDPKQRKESVWKGVAFVPARSFFSRSRLGLCLRAGKGTDGGRCPDKGAKNLGGGPLSAGRMRR
ncbi:MAG: hypothetical protein JRJ85_27710, partial [Deltaproteobacteria bacterium]|nr:hypothetical protein [Deltaproteobacteria bacterium]